MEGLLTDECTTREDNALHHPWQNHGWNEARHDAAVVEDEWLFVAEDRVAGDDVLQEQDFPLRSDNPLFLSSEHEEKPCKVVFLTDACVLKNEAILLYNRLHGVQQGRCIERVAASPEDCVEECSSCHGITFLCWWSDLNEPS